MSLVLYGTFALIQTVRHRDYFLPDGEAQDEPDAHAAPPSIRRTAVSGALLLAILSHCKAEGVATDRSSGALAVARDNAERLGLGARTRFVERDWTQEGWIDGLGQFDLVVSNPPYVENDAALEPDVRDYEPASALFAGPEGLDDYRVIIPELGKLLIPGGVTVLEIGATQADSVSVIARDSGFDVTLRHDLAGRPRALILR